MYFSLSFSKLWLKCEVGIQLAKFFNGLNNSDFFSVENQSLHLFGPLICDGNTGVYGGKGIEWDKYVILPFLTVKYCFRAIYRRD